MKKLLLLLVLGLFALPVFAQQDSPEVKESEENVALQDDEPYLIADLMPSFEGGDLNTFRKWVQSQVRYPKELLENGIQGRVVATFIIERDGSLTNVNILQTPDRMLSEETKRVLQSSPKWTPGKKDGRLVRVKYMVPVDYRFN